MPKKCIIVGGGIAGLSAGIAMRKAGYKVTLYEQAEAIEPMGAALSIWGNAMAGLDWLGCGEDVRAQSAQIREVSLTRRDGRALMGPMSVAGTGSYLPLRSVLQKVLLDRLGAQNVRLGMVIDQAIEHGDKVSILANGRALDEADILIAADGIYSQIASEHIGGEPRFAGYVGALGICEIPGQPLPPGHAQEIWGQGERFGVFDVGQGKRYWFYMRNASSASATTDMTLQAIQQASEGWPNLVRETLIAATACIPTAINAKPPPKSFGKGRIICIGDAAHPMEPNQGQGACQSIEDAWVLGILAQRLKPEEILPELERTRMKRAGTYVRESALMGRAARMQNRFIRSIVMGSFSITPRWVDARQLQSRLKVPEYF